jgi:peptidoglycan/xylan/chitin deacetylase (PgdA/CDA1 family)
MPDRAQAIDLLPVRTVEERVAITGDRGALEDPRTPERFVSHARNLVKRGFGSWLRQGVKALSYHAGLYPILQQPGAIQPTILFYHKVERGPVSIWGDPVLDTEQFEQHVAFLAREYHPIRLRELVAGLQGSAPLPDRAVVLTFDDGYRNNLALAAPILRHHGVPATFFVTTGLIGTNRWMWAYELEHMFHRYPLKHLRKSVRHPTIAYLCSQGLPSRVAMVACVEYLKSVPHAELLEVMGQLRERLPVELDPENRFLSWDEVRRLRDDGFEIGAHTETHPILPRLPLEEVERELAACRDTLERELGARSPLFAYPNGSTSRAVTERVGRFFEAAVTTRPGVCSPSTPLLALPRIGAPLSASDLAYQLTLQHLQGPPWLRPLDRTTG